MFQKPIVVVVQRGLQTLEIIVTPKKWSGQGTLGYNQLIMQ